MAESMLGLKHDMTLLVDYDPAWPLDYERERVRLAAALGGVARDIQHYGSTSVPGLPAKPILDILVGVAPFSDWRLCHDPLLSLGYDYAEHAGVAGHHIFGRGRDTTERTHLVHVVEFMGPSWTGNLAFRDALRRDAILRDAYLAEKRRAAEAAPNNRKDYNLNKQAFIEAAKASLTTPRQS